MFKLFSKKSKKEKKEKSDENENAAVAISRSSTRNETLSNFQFTQTVTEKVIENGVVTKEITVKTTNQSPTSKISFDDLKTVHHGSLRGKTFDPATIFNSFNQPTKSITTNDQPANKYTPKPARSTFQYSSLRSKPFEVFPTQSSSYGSNTSLKNTSATDRTGSLRSPISTRPNQSYTLKDISAPITIHVKKNYRFYDKVNKVPTYTTHGSRRGSLLLINNMQFEKGKSAERKGAEFDEKNIKELFKQLGFQIESHRNLKRDEMLNVLKKYSKRQSLKSMDINAVVMMSHGMGKREGGTVVMGSDDRDLPVTKVIEFFSNHNCTALLNKPKIFFFQCCRGLQYQVVESDASVFQEPITKVESDILLAYSTIPGFVSHRNPALGTWYIQALCKVFMEHACDTHLEDLLKMVDAMLESLAQNAGYAQTSSYESRGFKKCFLHPM